MNRDEFITYAKSIGFKSSGNKTSSVFLYKKFRLYISNTDYALLNSNNHLGTSNLNDTKIFENIFKKEFRTIKLKQLLS